MCYFDALLGIEEARRFPVMCRSSPSKGLLRYLFSEVRFVWWFCGSRKEQSQGVLDDKVVTIIWTVKSNEKIWPRARDLDTRSYSLLIERSRR